VLHAQSFPPGFSEEIARLLQDSNEQPLGHELFREAWQNRRTNPRSSLLLGIAAAEVGLKECIAVLVPGAEWLVQNAPTPPVVNMLTDYLPSLTAKYDFAGKVLPPPKLILDELKKGVKLRNDVTHKGAEPPKPESLENILLAVQDLLWLLDYYCGFVWALEHTRQEIRESLSPNHH
jgi:hypothetical protein